ncbi:MAG: DUF2442 domain-containing protein [Pseudomonadota bacterium]
MEQFPKIKKVQPIEGKRLIVTFDNGVKKIYDCSPLLKEEAFKPLQNDLLFRDVKADKHGYGVIWSDELDLSESEIWINGSPAEP